MFGLVVAIQILNFEMRTKNVEQKYEQQEIANEKHFESFYEKFKDLENGLKSATGNIFSLLSETNQSSDNIGLNLNVSKYKMHGTPLPRPCRQT